MKKLLVRLRSSITILLEGVIIAIVGLIAVIVFGGIGLANWTWDRLVTAWSNNE